MSDGIATFLTPVPIPREDRKELRLGGCAAAFKSENGDKKSHIFLDDREWLGHDFCKIREKLYGKPFEACEAKKLSGDRFWDFRDKHDHRAKPAKTPFLTVKNFLFDKICFPPEIRDKEIFRSEDAYDEVLTVLAICPELRHEFYGDFASFFPSEPVQGYLRTKTTHLTKDKLNDRLPSRIFDEGIISNQTTLLDK